MGEPKRVVNHSATRGSKPDSTTPIVAHNRLPAAGQYHVYLAPDVNPGDFLGDPDYLDAHVNDFPLLNVVNVVNLPLTLRLQAR